jgi:tRNA U34 5-methylaminomethyl-2-thiouridine-forming methyltransferase MnmC
MRFRLQETQGGITVFDEEAGECFKSRHNALAEAEHVFYRPGVKENAWWGKAAPFRILELGFGLGTNFDFLRRQEENIELTSIDRDLAGARFLLSAEASPALAAMLEEKEYREGPFCARLLEEDFFSALPRLIEAGEAFHCVYFDPFSPKANPDAWAEKLFRLCADLLLPEGRLVTYSVSRAAKDGAALAGLKAQKRDLPPELQKRSALVAAK